MGPRQSIHVTHDANTSNKLQLHSPERWDAVYEGAPEAGIWYQGKVGPIKKMSVLDELARMFEAKGWTRINDSSYKNYKITVGDITTENVGMLNGKPVIFDPEAAYNEDIIKVSNAKFKNK